MAELSVYLFWSGLLTSVLAAAVYALHGVAAGLWQVRRAAVEGGGVLAVVAPAGDRGGGRFATTSAGMASLFFVASALARWAASGRPPLANMFEATVALSGFVGVSYLLFERQAGTRRFGAFAMALVAAFAGVASFFPAEVQPLVPALQNAPLLLLHVSVMMVSYAVISVAFVGAVVYLLQGGESGHRFAALPSGEAAGELAHRAVMAGFLLLGLGIALGAWWANSAWGRYWGWDPKETSALVLWLSLAAYFHARAGSGTVANAPGFRRILPAWIRRGPRPDPMWWVVVAFFLMLFTYFGVNLWVTGLHSYAGV